ncbi:hypothetical protein B1756_02490 [Natrarchaeobaculum aegyptiacum]|uniref:Uncharacterized protein n=2 Tax=Natrarchaeobaculum aegyptiacum TaxID=745377 RepID=A0A2Z2HQ46_9EURY|nr:hypothetical protein B1756_02490 [Natrarchaeobaculum aegyptiacum]
MARDEYGSEIGGDDEMNCVRCGHESGYNRAVIDRFSGAKIGHLCMNCEREEFGNVLEYSTRGDDECVLCERDGQIELPRFVPVERQVGETVVVESEIEDGTAPRLCDEHFHAITEAERLRPVLDR